LFGAYMLFRAFHLDPLASLPLVAAVMFLAGYALQRGLINRFVTRPEHMQFLLMLGIAIMLTSLMLMGFGPDARNVELGYAFDSYDFGGLLLDKVRVLAAAGAVIGAALLWAFFRFARPGKAIRACAAHYLG